MATGRREALLDGAVEHVLATGVGELTLRPLAAALGTSDRMLIYHFGSRDGLVVAVLERIAADLRRVVLDGLPAGRSSPTAVLAALAGLLAQRDEAVDRRLRIWLEVAGHAALGRSPHREVAHAVVEGWLDALVDRLDVEGDPRAAAAGVLAVVDGSLLLDALGHGEAAAAGGAWLMGELLDRP